MLYFFMSKQWHGCHCLGSWMCTQMLMPVTAYCGCTNTVRESALKIDSEKLLHLLELTPQLLCVHLQGNQLDQTWIRSWTSSLLHTNLILSVFKLSNFCARWRVMECEPLSVLLWSLAEHSLRLFQDSLFKTLHVAWNVFLVPVCFQKTVECYHEI